MPIISSGKGLRQEFRANLGYEVKDVSQNNTTKPNQKAKLEAYTNI